jgi:hypothetical protein
MQITGLEEWNILLATWALAKLPPMTPHLGRPCPDLGEVIDDLLSFPAYYLAKLGPILEAFASQFIEEMYPAVMPSPFVERLAAVGYIGVIGAQTAVSVGEAEKRLFTVVQVGEGTEETGFLHQRLIGEQALLRRAHEEPPERRVLLPSESGSFFSPSPEEFKALGWSLVLLTHHLCAP